MLFSSISAPSPATLHISHTAPRTPPSVISCIAHTPVLPAAVPGILSGVILSIGRIVGESAALIFTAGSVAAVPNGLFSSTRTLAVHMYCLLSEGLYTNQAYATAVILLGIVLLINFLSGLLAKRVSAKDVNEEQ